MANIKSAKKRILVINKKTLRNKMVKSELMMPFYQTAELERKGNSSSRS